ncbi:O-methyltransferase [Paraburkholderia sp. DHOC27]|uniref:O-methyltransferase n=1 Tax=Paraburkholderia sp. DHOC27 TaxID=2303330 RepID=UPI000E3C6C6C|nr:class I SAM-dependent methyltransferase [Paraburkholderia sp. DHOC27]RFU48688.1 SAM-dependent methyltransferase [Paraburkholderia sp. DHOC27]
MLSSHTQLLKQLHEQSNAQVMDRARAQFAGSNEAFLEVAEQYGTLAPRLRGRFLQSHGFSTEDFESSQGTPLSLAVSAEMGQFLRNVVLSARPTRILELGSSCGVSTLYFAEAIRLLDEGIVVATELDRGKCAQLRSNLKAAKLERYVELREGDVFETVQELDGTFDLIFIDVWASAYLPLFKQVERLLIPGSVVIADNMYTAETEVRPFKEYLDKNTRYSSTTLDFESGVEFAVVVS